MSFEDLAGRIGAYVINPLIVLIIGVGLLVFIYGLVEYLYALNVKGKKSKEGVDHMIWGIAGMLIMVSALSIIKVIAGLVGQQLPAGY